MCFQNFSCINSRLVPNFTFFSFTGYVTEDTSRFLKGDYKYLFCHPEDILRKEICDVLCTDVWQESVSHVFVDEAHCIVQWGYEFRPDYKNIGKLRAVFPDAKFVALTATATKSMIKEIANNLRMSQAKTICGSVDRPNLKISVFKRLPSSGGNKTAEESFRQVITPYVEELCNDPVEFPKTIMYSKLKWCGLGYSMVCQEAVKHEDHDLIVSSASQYHAACTEQV